MRILILLLTVMLSTPALAEQAPGQFDYYLLNLSWEPEFCHSPRNAHFDECKKGGQGFTVHGLWPQYVKGYPEHCAAAAGPRKPEQWLDIMPSSWLVQHEWSTHGTCSGLKPDAYFDLIRSAHNSIVIPDMLKAPTRSMSLTPMAIKQAFVASNPGLTSKAMAISCGNNYLTAVEFCLSRKDLKPVTCGQIRDCRANQVRITPVH